MENSKAENKVLTRSHDDDTRRDNKKYATAAYITLIQSPNYPPSLDYSRLLKRYFSKPKLLREGQIINIKSSLDYRYQERLQNDLLIKWPIITWRVTKLEPDTSGFVYKGITNLYQSGATQAFLNREVHKNEQKNEHTYQEDNYYNLSIVLDKTLYFSKYHKRLSAFLEPITNSSLDFIGTILLHGRSGCGKRLLLERTAENLELNLYQIEANDLIGENAAITEAKIRTALMKASSFAPCLIHITKIDLLCQLEDLDLERVEQNFLDVITLSLNTSRSTWPIAIVATTNNFDMIDKSPLSSIFHSNLEMNCLDKIELKDMVTQIMRHSMKIEDGIIEMFVDSIVKTDLSGMYIGNVIILLAQFDYHLKLSDKSTTSIEEAIANVLLTINQLRIGSNDESTKQKTQTNWSDVGGMDEIKRHIADAIQMSHDYPQLKLSGMRRSGLLLCGPPGTGKTLLAKAVATECNLSFISVKGPELINMYVGQSEENVRKVFQKAREQSPSVIFFDELDSLAPSRGQSGDSGGVMDRVVSQILAEMDGITKDEVFVIGATNRIDLIDQSLLRPGRFDKVIEVPLPNDSETRVNILKALTRKMNLSEDVDLTKIETKCPTGMSGADFYSLCANAMNITLMECVNQIANGLIKEADSQIVITQKCFMEALARIT